MTTDYGGSLERRDALGYSLEKGFIYFTRKPALISAVLGDCVSVCLWDKKKRYGGMNHFCQPAVHTRSQATPRYGNVATSALIKMMEDAGSKRSHIVAQVFGGAHLSGENRGTLGGENVRVARQVLERKRIRIVSEDTGGSMGRKIVFDTSTGKVAVLKVYDIRKSDWEEG